MRHHFAAAVLMPYSAFLAEARASKDDFDHIATRFGVSFEQASPHQAAILTQPVDELRRGVTRFDLS